LGQWGKRQGGRRERKREMRKSLSGEIIIHEVRDWIFEQIDFIK
jgi:hypothetical protein